MHAGYHLRDRRRDIGAKSRRAQPPFWARVPDSVAGGDRVREVSKGRYGEFVDMADQHFAEFPIQVTRLTDGTEADVVRQCMELEKGLEWALTRLRREASVPSEKYV